VHPCCKIKSAVAAPDLAQETNSTQQKKNHWARDKDLEKNTDGHRGSFGCRRNEPRKLTGGLEEPQIRVATEKSQAAKTTQGR
jgi:hypothetical protein